MLRLKPISRSHQTRRSKRRSASLPHHPHRQRRLFSITPSPPHPHHTLPASMPLHRRKALRRHSSPPALRIQTERSRLKECAFLPLCRSRNSMSQLARLRLLAPVDGGMRRCLNVLSRAVAAPLLEGSICEVRRPALMLFHTFSNHSSYWSPFVNQVISDRTRKKDRSNATGQGATSPSPANTTVIGTRRSIPPWPHNTNAPDAESPSREQTLSIATVRPSPFLFPSLPSERVNQWRSRD